VTSASFPRRAAASLKRRREPALRLTIQRASRAAHVPSDALLRKWARTALSRAATVTLRYVGEAEGRRLNRRYRRRDYATNVLTFVYAGRPLEGDIVVCAPVVAREARSQARPAAAHHAHLLVHGLLHLQGYDHERPAEARRMERRERSILARLGFPDPYVRSDAAA
jgi:probable rRNA maturation factor